jgi:hypothetical protein
MYTLSCHEWASPIFPGNIGSAVNLNSSQTASKLIGFDRFDILSDMETRRRCLLVTAQASCVYAGIFVVRSIIYESEWARTVCTRQTAECVKRSKSSFFQLFMEGNQC